MWKFSVITFSKLILVLLFILSNYQHLLAEQLIKTSCSADFLCVNVYQDETLRLELENKTSKPISFQLILTGTNLEPYNLKKFKLDKPQTISLFSLPSTAQLLGYEFRIHYGHQAYQHDKDYLYTLPFAQGSAFSVTQSHTSLSTHHPGNRYAIDWAMPEGTSVYAARDGLVVSTYAKSKSGGISTNASANHIWIQHSDGTIGKYMHLSHQGIFVEEGQLVKDGDLIGASGNTGYSSGAHLHFSVSSLTSKTFYQTFNVRFKTDSGIHFIKNGITYRR